MLETYASTKTKSNTYTGTTGRISVSGNVINIDAAYVGQSSITTLGTITTGTWSGTAIATSKGGTPTGGATGFVLTKNSATDYDYVWAASSGGGSGIYAGTGSAFTTYATGDIIYASATNVLSKLSAVTNGYVLTLASGVPTWAASSGGVIVTDNGSKSLQFSNPGASGGWHGSFTFFTGYNNALASSPTMRIYGPNSTGPGITIFGGSTDAEASAVQATTNVGIKNRITSFNTYDTGINISSGTAANYGALSGKYFGINIATGTALSNFGTGVPSAYIGMQYENSVSAGYGASLNFFVTQAAYPGSVLFMMKMSGLYNNIGILTSSPDKTAALDITSTTQGFLPPRMTTSQKTAIASPAEGLHVYDTTLHQTSYYNGTSWINL